MTGVVLRECDHMIRVLIVDDSPTTLAFLVEVLGRDPGIDVVGSARDGIEGVKLAARLHPDVIVMDVNMPGMDGYQACRLIMEENPAPIIVQSSTVSLEDTANSFRALQAGAVATLLKPTGPADPRREDLCRRLVRTVKAMAEVKVVRRHMRHRQGGGAAWVPETVGDGRPNLRRGRIEIAALGASTGGPQVLHEILGALQGKCPVPVLVTQHISPGFLEGMLEWLGRETGLPLRIAGHGDVVSAGHLLFRAGRLAHGGGPRGKDPSPRRPSRERCQALCLAPLPVRCRLLWQPSPGRPAHRHGPGRRV